jgi:catechol 2,3-dioxygenase-like lactoylglutathione lyase family enzyme
MPRHPGREEACDADQPAKDLVMILNCGQVLVDDQDKALRFYTETLGFVKVMDVPDGDSGMRSLIVEAPEGIPGVGLELMGTYTPAARAYQQAFRAAGYAFTVLCTADIHTEYQQLKARGVHFEGAPEDAGPVWTVKFDDTCGNLLNLVQFKDEALVSPRDNDNPSRH